MITAFFPSLFFLGTQNYVDLWRDPVFWKGPCKNTVVFAAVAIPLSTFSIHRSGCFFSTNPSQGQGIYRTIFFLPSLVPAISLAILWQWMLNGPHGTGKQPSPPLFGFA